MPHTKSATAKRMILSGLGWLDDWHAIGGGIGIEMQQGGKLAIVVPVAPEGVLGTEQRRKMIALLRDFDVKDVTVAMDLKIQAIKNGAAIY
jgi:hypothetical protein